MSRADVQLSCVLRLQEPEAGGDLLVYDRGLEACRREVPEDSLGYREDVVSGASSCRVSGLAPGDLVVLNPNRYHRVARIAGRTPRITLGIFAGLFLAERRIVHVGLISQYSARFQPKASLLYRPPNSVNSWCVFPGTGLWYIR